MQEHIESCRYNQNNTSFTSADIQNIFFQPPPSEFMFWIVLASVPANQTAQQAFIQWDDCSN